MRTIVPLSTCRDTEVKLDWRDRLKSARVVRLALYLEAAFPLSIVHLDRLLPSGLSWAWQLIEPLSTSQNHLIANLANLFAIIVFVVALLRKLWDWLSNSTPPTPTPPTPGPKTTKKNRNVRIVRNFEHGVIVREQIDESEGEESGLLGWLMNGAVYGVPARKVRPSLMNRLNRMFVDKPAYVGRVPSVYGPSFGDNVLAGNVSVRGLGASSGGPKAAGHHRPLSRRHQLVMLKGKLVSLWHYLHGDRLKLGFAY